MRKPYDLFDAEPTPPECRATVDGIQRALDGDGPPEALDADPHFGACATCRERLRAARVLLSVLATPSEPVPAPVGFTDRVLHAVHEDRHTQTRRSVYKVAAWAALAAAILLVVFEILQPRPEQFVVMLRHEESATQPEVAPEPRAKGTRPTPNPIHIGDEVAKAGQVFRDAPKPITDSVALAPKLIDVLANPFTMPAGPGAPMGMEEALQPARKSISELPEAARLVLEPVTGTAQKAFSRLLRDVASVNPKPNS